MNNDKRHVKAAAAFRLLRVFCSERQPSERTGLNRIVGLLTSEMPPFDPSV
ncbi:hypothetical protein [Jeotgalibacillus proteolyticus]|uniref:hypothetical protein n=1 Tax=Jeotgalibacillus proteolyticus TaxID=2082395 RepID=UPI003CF128BD